MSVTRGQCDGKLFCFFSDAGPRLFLTCPMNVNMARLWFADLWNYSIIPYLVEALRDVRQVTDKHVMTS